jgi:hypothetical protein
MQYELGKRAFVDLVEEEMFPPADVIFHRASDELKQHYFDGHIPQQEQAKLRAIIEAGPRALGWIQ